MKNKEQILNGYQATFALSKHSKSQIYLAMDEYNKELIDAVKEIQMLVNPCTQIYKKCEYILKNEI